MPMQVEKTICFKICYCVFTAPSNKKENKIKLKEKSKNAKSNRVTLKKKFNCISAKYILHTLSFFVPQHLQRY